MKKRLIYGLLALTLLTGVGMAAPRSVPLRGAGYGMITAANPPTLSGVGTGVATVLGRFTREEQIVLTQTGTFTGSIVFTTPDGSELHCDVSGGFTGPGTASGTYTFTGGTGRFDGASGEADFNINLDSDGIHFTFQFIGTIDLL